jgi:hypothetical protein
MLQKSYKGEIRRLSIVQNEMIKLNTEQFRWPTANLSFCFTYGLYILVLGLHG